eukprot:494892_1
MASEGYKHKFITLKYNQHNIKCRIPTKGGPQKKIDKINKEIQKQWQLNINEYTLLLKDAEIQPDDSITLVKTLSITPVPKSGCITINIVKSINNVHMEDLNDDKYFNLIIHYNNKTHKYPFLCNLDAWNDNDLLNLKTEISKTSP